MKAALALLSGALLALSFPKFGHPAFAWIALAPLVTACALASRETGRLRHRPFVLGVLTGLVYFLGTIYWVQGVMSMHGGLPPFVAALLALLLASYLALYVGVFASLVAAAVRKFGVRGVWLAPLFWVATEWMRGPGGFPWLPLGSSQSGVMPIVQLASVTGVFGLSALLALVASAASAVSLSRRPAHLRAAIATLVAVGLIGAAGAFRVAESSLVRSGQVLRVGLVQGNIEQTQKWNPAFRDMILRRYLDLSRQVIGGGAALVVWPESSTPFYFEADSALAAPVRALAAETRTPFVIGSDTYETGADGKVERLFNASVLIGADGRPRAEYRKMKLVPFGEFVPFRNLLFFVAPLVESVGDFTPGREAIVFDAGVARLGTAICFESIYPWIGRHFVAGGSQLLATITNDAWFGVSSAPYQHFAQGALRAVEEGRYLVRAANTGISGAIDPYGRVVLQTALFEQAAVTVDVRLLDGRTIYSRTGDVIAWLSLAATAAFIIASRRPRRPSHTPTP